ncbi:MAG: hypothetical protein JNJ75_16785 [Cyclobacteriaceae bacterium]|nr:hypothetical protein [Cyclobacteriaceae bacterium]
MDNQLTVKVSDKGIYFNPSLLISFQQTNIPKEHLTFRPNQDIFWIVEMLEYKSSDKCLKLKVNNYNTNDILSFNEQQPKKEVKKVLFEKLDWEKLEPLLSSYRKSGLRDVVFNIETSPFSKDDLPTNKLFKSGLPFPSSSVNRAQDIQPRVSIVTEKFSLDFNDVCFMLGCVYFKRHIKKLRKEFEVRIYNEHILAEFEHIKIWFAKKLKIKKLKVTVVITLRHNEAPEVLATSAHIDQITPELIDSVKYQRTVALSKEPRVQNPDKSLFTIQEIFAQIDSGDSAGNVFSQSEEDILNFFIAKSGIRNGKQLVYLADKKQTENHKLHYTLHPNFGFLFLIEGTEYNHFVWELLNSHATYIWSIPRMQNEIELQYKRVESEINSIKISGRENYKRANRDVHQEADLVFSVIKHQDIASGIVDAFEKWRSKLDEKLL